MKLITSFFLGCLVWIAKTTSAQEFKLSGVLFEQDSKIRVALAEITNTRSGYSVGSNDMGLFEIRTLIGDTLLVTKHGYNDFKLVVTDHKNVVLTLSKGTMLNEVLIRGKTKQQSLAEIEKDFRSKGSFYAGKPPLALLSPFGGSPLTFFYELFGKTPRQARKFRKYREIENEQLHVDQFFNREMVLKHTPIKGSEVDVFMVKYRPDYKQTIGWNAYDGIKWIVDAYKKYKDTVK